MIDAFLRGLESIFAWLIEASWQASVLVALVLLLHLILRSRLNPRWHHALWLLVIARLLLPFLPESAFSVFQFAPSPPPVVTESVTEPIFNALPVPAAGTPLLPAPPAAYPFSAFTVLALVWLAGALALLVLTWQVNRRFARHVAAAPLVADLRLLKLAESAQQELGLHRRLRIIESAQVQSPAIMGLFRPTLILPKEVRARFADAELRFIFLHEFAHLKRGDLFLQWLVALLQILHWFNPVLWYAFRRMRADREPATDALVLSCTGEEYRESYGQVLVKLLEHYHTRHSLPTLVGILEDKDQFKRRFSLIVQFTRGAYGWSLLGAIILGTLAIVGLTKGKNENLSDLGRLQSLCNKVAEKGDVAEFTRLSEKIKSIPSQSGWQVDDGVIIDAVARGDRPMVQAIINQGWDRNKYSVMRLGGAAAKSPGMRDWLVAKGVKVPEYNTGEALIDAAAREDIPEMDRLVKAGVDINYRGESEWTPVTKAAVSNKVESVRFLLAHGADPNSIKSPGWNYSGLCLTGSPAVADLLLAAGANLNATVYSDHAHIIDYCISNGPVEMVKWFIAHGVDPAKVKSERQTFLFNVANPEIAEILIQHGIDVNARDDRGSTALLEICGYSNNPAPVAEVLLKHGADPNVQDKYGITPLMCARNGATVDVLVAHGADLKARNKDGIGVLMMTDHMADVSRIEALIRHGVPFDPRTDGPTLLCRAARNGQIDIITYLLGRGIDPNIVVAVNKFVIKNKPITIYETPLQCAVAGNQYEAAKFLLDKGAKIIGHNPGTNTSVDELAYAISNKEDNIARLLWDHGARGVSPLIYAIGQGQTASQIELLIDQGSSLNPPTDHWPSPLELAAKIGRLDLVSLLIRRGANIHGSGEGDEGPIGDAIYAGQDEVVDYLLQHGVIVDERDVEAAVAQSIPYRPGERSKDHYERTVKLLIDAGALKKATPTDSGKILAASLGYPGEGGNAAAFKMLLDAGLDPESPMPASQDKSASTTSVIGYCRDLYQKRNSPAEARRAEEIKPLLDLLEAADKGAPKSDATVSPPPAATDASQKAYTYLEVSYVETANTSAMPGGMTTTTDAEKPLVQNPKNKHVLLNDFPLQPGMNTLKGKTPWGSDFTVTLNWSNTLANKAQDLRLKMEWLHANGGDVSYGSEFKASLRPDECFVVTGPWKTKETSNLLISFVNHPSEQPQKTDAGSALDEAAFYQALERDRTLMADSSVTSSTLAADAQMLLAIQKGDFATLKKVLEHAVDPNTFDPDRFYSCPVYWAVHFNQPEILKLLLEHFATGDIGPAHETPLQLAQRTHPNLVPIIEEGIKRNRALLTARLTEKLHSIHIDLPGFSGAPLSQITKFLLDDATAKAGYLDRRVNIGTMDLPPSTTITSPARPNISVWDALQTIADANKLKFDVDGSWPGNIKLYPPRDEAVIHPPAGMTDAPPQAPTKGNADTQPTGANTQADSASNTGDSTAKAKEPDPDEWNIRNLKVSDIPLTELAQKLTAITKADDPNGVGVAIDVKVPPGEAPLKITYGYPPYTGDLGNLLYHLAGLYPIRYELQIASRNPDSQQAPITVTQLPAAEAQLNKKAGQTKVDLDFNGTDIAAALKAVQSQAAAKGFSFDLNTDALQGQSTTPITIKARGWSVQHALLSICYLADVVPRPLVNFTGYRLIPGSTTELHDRTSIRFGICNGFFKVDATNAYSHILASLKSSSGENRVWGPSEVMPAYSSFYRGKDVSPSWGDITTQFSYHHKDGDSPGFVVPVDGAPFLDTKFQMYVADKTHIRATITVRLKKPDGTILRELTGQWIAASGTVVSLVVNGAPLLLDTPDDPKTKSNLYILAQADYVDSGKRESDIEPQQLELVSPTNNIQQVELSEAPVKSNPASTPPSETTIQSPNSKYLVAPAQPDIPMKVATLAIKAN